MLMGESFRVSNRRTSPVCWSGADCEGVWLGLKVGVELFGCGKTR